MALWIKDVTSRAPMTVYHRAEPGPDGLVRIVFNPEGGGTVASVHTQLSGQPVTQAALESLLQESGGLIGG